MQKDLVILAADKNIEFTIRGLFSRPQALKIRSLEFDIFVHPEHDPGCFKKSDDFLRPFANSYQYGVVVFDKEGCGREKASRKDLEIEIEERLSKTGWNTRARAIVLDPELEVWVWSDSPQVDIVLGWDGKEPDLRTWLENEGRLKAHAAKPSRPKEALEAALRKVSKARSSARYAQLAQQVSFERCSDPAFLKLKAVLQSWFSEIA